MKNLRVKFERFCFKNRDKGIPNLMLYIAVGSAIVHLMSFLGNSVSLYSLLCFNKTLILQGQVWRLFTYVFTYAQGSTFLVLIGLYFCYQFSRQIEYAMGTFRFNLFYFSGVILMDVFALLFIPSTVTGELIGTILSSQMAYYLHLSLILMYITLSPDSTFLILFIIPVKAWFLGVVYLVLVFETIYSLAPLFPYNLFPLVGLANYFLFAGKDVRNLFPFAQNWGQKKPKVKKASHQAKQENYSHRCVVCGRTDASNPELEFRYCSRCNGYFCYCQDHINNHTHIE